MSARLQLGDIIAVKAKDERGNNKICHAMILDHDENDLITLKIVRLAKPPIQKPGKLR